MNHIGEKGLWWDAEGSGEEVKRGGGWLKGKGVPTMQAGPLFALRTLKDEYIFHNLTGKGEWHQEKISAGLRYWRRKGERCVEGA